MKKGIMVIMVGPPGSGKSTFCDHVIRVSPARSWVRICQDTIGNGKSGTKTQCLTSAATALKDGQSVFIDRCNLDREKRTDFVKLGGSLQVDVHGMVLDLPAKRCISRVAKRSAHEGNLQGGKAAAVVNRMLQKKELPKLNEGFSRITFCQNESDVQAAMSTYSALGPSDILPSGCFGQGLLFPANESLQLKVLCDSDWGSNPNDRKSITGYCMFLGSSLISWHSKKQSVTARSSVKAEYRAFATCCEVLWLHSLLQDLMVTIPLSVVVHCDSIAAIVIASNPVYHAPNI